MSRRDAIKELLSLLKLLRAITAVTGMLLISWLFTNWSNTSTPIAIAGVISTVLLLASVVIAQSRINEILQEL